MLSYHTGLPLSLIYCLDSGANWKFLHFLLKSCWCFNLPKPILVNLQVVDLMCARLEVQRSSVISSVKENKCDWMAAIYHLLHDQPETQAILRDISRSDMTSSARNPITSISSSPPEVDSGLQTSITAVMRKCTSSPQLIGFWPLFLATNTICLWPIL